MLNKKMCSALCVLAMSANILPVLAQEDNSFLLESVSTSGNSIVLDFSDNVDESTLSYLTVHDSNGDDVVCEKNVNGDKITVDGSNFKLNEKYYVIAGKNLTSNGAALQETYIYDVLNGGIADNFDTNTTTSDNWKTIGWYNSGSGKSNIRDNKLMLANFEGSQEYTVPNMENTACYASNASGVVFNNGYTTYENAGDSVLEFDYMSGVTNSDVTGGPQSYSSISYAAMRVFLRANGVTISQPNNVYAEAENGGAYILNVSGDGTTAFLEKWGGTKFEITQSNGTVVAGQKLKSDVKIDYTPGQTVRYRITTQNVTDGVRILFETAPYSDGTLGEYKTVIDYTDENNAFKNGTFLFGFRESVIWDFFSPPSCWYSSHYLDNLSFSTFGAAENKQLAAIKAKTAEIENAQNILDYEDDIDLLEKTISQFEAQMNYSLGYDSQIADFKARVQAAKDKEVTEEIESIKSGIDKVWQDFSGNYKNALTEIEKLEERIAAIEKSTGAEFDSAYTAKIGDMKKAAAVEFQAEITEKFSGKESLTVAFFGGSLTEGGAIYQSMIKEWLAEKTGISADNITVIKAGNGGTGSDWHQFRQYSDVMVYNPDLVLIDINANDVTENSYVPCESIIRVESIIRRFNNMENPPVVGYLHLPNRQYMIQYLLKKAGYEYYLNNNKPTQLRGEPWIAHEPVAKYYGMTDINVDKFLADNFCDIGQLPADESGKPISISKVTSPLEKAQIQTTYYVKNNGKWSECTADTDGAIEVITNYSFLELTYDWNKVEAFTKNTYNKRENINTWTAFSSDGTHCDMAYDGNKMWGDIMLYLLGNDPYAAFKMQKNPQKPLTYTSESYDKLVTKRIELSTQKINELDNLTIDTSAGGNVQDTDKMYTNRMRSRSGILITGPAKLEYNFRGQTFYMTCRNSDSDNILKYASMDGKAYANSVYMVNNLLSGDTEHKLVIDLPENVTIGLSEIFVDEASVIDNYSENGKYVEVDLTPYANIYGAYTENDAPVFAETSELFYNGNNPKIKIGWLEDNYRGTSPSAADIKNIKASVPYDFTMLDSARYKGVSPYTGFNIDKMFQWRDLSAADPGNKKLALTAIDVPDDYYEKLNMLIYTAKTSAITDQTATVTYTDGTTDNITFTVCKNAANASTDNKAAMVYQGKEISNIDGSVSGKDAFVYEYALDIPNKEKRVDYIGFSDSGSSMLYRIFGMTLTKTYDDALFDVYFTSGESTISDIAKYAGKEINVNYRVSAGTTGKIYTAIYDSSDKVIAISATPASLAGDTGYMKLLTGKITVPENVSADYKVKSFLWNSEFAPLTKIFN